MRAVLVLLVILAIGLSAGASVASGGSWTAGSPGDFKGVAKSGEFNPILVNSPGKHGFAPPKSQEADMSVVKVPQTNIRRLPH